jgi:hypothetical protein
MLIVRGNDDTVIPFRLTPESKPMCFTRTGMKVPNPGRKSVV